MKKKIKCWVTGHMDCGEMIYYMWADEPEWVRQPENDTYGSDPVEAYKWEGKNCVDVCRDNLRNWLGKLPTAEECIELEVKEKDVWLPPEV